tara:strand:+ start:719 stop:919 length:201 start_codon:yes stop_codon:yes gene_type:complete
MKITKRQLRKIIKEEKAKMLSEQSDPGTAYLMSLEDAWQSAYLAGADLNELGRMTEQFLANMGYEG